MTVSMPKGLITAAPASNSGKTAITLGLIRALTNAGGAVGSLKIGPDYIDTDFHRLASGRDCLNLDMWAMREETVNAQVAAASSDADLVIAEGVMGLFDGALDGTGSTADAAAKMGWPVILVADVKGQSASAAALVEGFAQHRKGVQIAGVIFNRVGSPRHEGILARAMDGGDVPVLGYVPNDSRLDLPSRHLGLVQAREHGDLETWLDAAANIIGGAVELDRIADLATTTKIAAIADSPAIPPLGQKMAIARDDAFAFVYPHILDSWRRAGSEISFFSPLADEAPAAACDAVYLPGGYPELHAAKLAGNRTFLGGLRDAASNNKIILGECGGYMVLGESLTDADGNAHAMAGLLPLSSDFSKRKLHLGYRLINVLYDGVLATAGTKLRGHEFHYAGYTETPNSDATPLFTVWDALGENSHQAGLQAGSVAGSFIHLIDRV